MADDQNKDLEHGSTNSPKEEKEAKQEDSNDIIPPEILESIPAEERSKVVGIIKQQMFSSITRRSNPIADKITGEHITQIINKSDEQDKRDRDERKGQRFITCFLF